MYASLNFKGCAPGLLLGVGLLAGCTLPGPADDPGVVTSGYISAFQTTVKPELVTRVEPVYPPRLQRMGIRGRVVIFFIVEENGSVREAEAVERESDSDDQREFENAALAAVRQWKFRPGEKNAAPVRVSLRIPIGFGGG